MNWTLLIGIGTSIATIVLAFVAGYQAWLLRNSAMADVILKLDERFNSKLLEKRRGAAQYLQAGTDQHNGDIEDVLDFFETLGLLVQRRALDRKMVWHTYFYWIHGYWRYANPFVARQQSTSPARYTDINYLHDAVMKIEFKKRGPIDEAEWDDFLQLEATG